MLRGWQKQVFYPGVSAARVGPRVSWKVRGSWLRPGASASVIGNMCELSVFQATTQTASYCCLGMFKTPAGAQTHRDNRALSSVRTKKLE